MRVDAFYYGQDLEESTAEARRSEGLGFDGWFTGQTSHDPFLTSALAAAETSTVRIGTGIAVALSRSPMDVAYSANDVQQLASGRFVLGLGTQVRAHITRRFGMPWSAPARRMREFILALRAIWQAWHEDEPLDFRGEFYQHTLMTPVFSPGPNPYGPPPVWLAAVGPVLTETAGEIGDGLLCHGFTTQAYLRDHTLPALARGLDRAGRKRGDVEVALPLFAISGDTDEDVRDSERAVRRQVSFYASTPAYRSVMDLHGWGELQEELHGLSRQRRWDEMAGLVDDDVLDAFAVRGDPRQLAGHIVHRFAGLVDRVTFLSPPRFNDLQWATFLNEVADLSSAPDCAQPHTEENA